MKHVVQQYWQKGFTLVEVTLYMGLFVMMLTILTTMFTSTLDVYSEATATSAIEQEGRYLISRLSYDIRRASAITVPAGYNDPSTVLQLTVDGQVYRYEIQNNLLVIIRSGTTDVVMTPRLQMNNFTVNKIGTVGGSPTIQLSFTLVEPVENNPASRDFTTTVGTRL